MEVHQLHRVRRHRKVEGVRHMRHLHPLRYAAHSADVRLNDVRAAAGDQVFEAEFGVLVLPGGHGYRCAGCHGGEPFDVVREHGLLEPPHA